MSLYVDTLTANFLKDFDLLKVKLIDDVEQVKKKVIDERDKNATLEAEKRTLTEKLAAKDASILVLTEGAHRINNSEEKDGVIKKLKDEIVALKRKLEPLPSASTPEPGHSGHSVKRKRITTDVNQSDDYNPSTLSISAKLLHKFTDCCFGFRITILSEDEIVLNIQDCWQEALDTGEIKSLNYTQKSPIESVHKVGNGFVTELGNGFILGWRDGEIVRSTKNSSFSKVKVINGEIVAAERNGPLFIMDADWNTVKLLPAIKSVQSGNEPKVEFIEGNKNYLAIALNGGRVYFYDRRQNYSRMEYVHSGRYCGIMNMAIEGAVLATASVDYAIHVWDMNFKKELWKIPGLGASCGGTCLRINNGRVISARLNMNTKVWEAHTGKLKSSLPPLAGWDIDINPRGTWLAVPDKNKLQIWSLESYNKCAEIVLAAEIGNVRFQTDGKIVVELYNGEAHLITFS